MDFGAMLTEAQKALECQEGESNIAAALLTDNDELIIVKCDTFDNCIACKGYKNLDLLYAIHDNKIVRMVTVIRDEKRVCRLEPPCEWLRKYLLALNKNNLNAEVLGQSYNGYTTKPLKAYFPLNDF